MEKKVINAVTFQVKGKPIGKQRPRVVKRGKYIHTYTPEKTVDYENQIKIEYKRQVKHYYGEKPLFLRVKAFFAPPKYFSKAKKKMALEGKLPPINVPIDVDNIAKAVQDSLNELAFKDDKQIMELRVEKHFSENEYIEVLLGELVYE